MSIVAEISLAEAHVDFLVTHLNECAALLIITGSSLHTLSLSCNTIVIVSKVLVQTLHDLKQLIESLIIASSDIIFTLLHQPVLQSASATAVLTLLLLSAPSSLSGGVKGSLQSPFSPLLLQVKHLLLNWFLSLVSWLDVISNKLTRITIDINIITVLSVISCKYQSFSFCN